ncbi:hypothetical protein P153DRAFT_281050 [Dothidotthia symphoricarpi CBS 119687]|uniref:Heme haloperoxidase family profile domain-containing protein n=1 Tax=Dothidotthia symphoricarpi CBS 119687 TaxID=1392245 RepID=A0A6A6ARU8_9PLEO|nr:uncharacterized protein P153DRAFT_281050 [Dothidotthia symphoricarpi CBS 119687]KAF2133715.1 hypothetical protein P153DRAFT_281050 [Dothidotthia symphoricarpi CBS 119687]
MKVTSAVLLGLPALSVAYPGMMGASSRSELESQLKAEYERAASEKREAEPQVTSLLSGLTGVVNGLLTSVTQAVVVSSNKRPETGYSFQAPGPGDSRGPCPGLNLLANHGYLPRDGHVTFGQIVAATARGFNMGADLATVLATFAVLTDGDIDTLSFYLGAGKGGIGGLNRHSTVEADISPTREDYYNGCGDNHHLSSRIVKQLVGYVNAESSKQFTINAMANQYAQLAQFSKTNNPYLYYFPFPQIVSVVAFNFYPQFFSNGTYGAGGVANYKSISSIIGAEYDSKSGEFKYVPERWPENWYRRATPYGAVQALTEGFTLVYPRNIVTPGVAQLGTGNFNLQTVLCDVYQGINSITPLQFGGSLEKSARAASWAISVLDPYFKFTALGCPTAVLSPNTDSFLYPNANKQGGPKNAPPGSKTGDNVYNKIYFTSAPVKPAC